MVFAGTFLVLLPTSAQLCSAEFDCVLPGLGWLGKNCFIFGGGGASYSANSQGVFYQSDLFQSKTSSLISCYTVWLPLPVKTSLYIYATRLYGIISTSNSSNSQISLETGSLKNTCLKYFLRLASSSNFSILNFNI